MLASIQRNTLYMQSVQNGCSTKHKKLNNELVLKRNSLNIKDYR
jgi:hypothetical protein